MNARNPAVAQNAMSHVRMDGVSKTYESDKGTVEALRDVSLSVPRGSFVSVVGPSGCGKSTLLRCLAGLEETSAGRIFVDGVMVDQPPFDMGMVFQRDALLDWRNVVDNVLLPVDFRRRPRREFEARAAALLDLFGLAGFHHRYPRELSGGMRMRVAICRALLDNPPLLLMDEPFAALDAFTRDELNIELQKLLSLSGATTFFVTHNISEAILLADTVVVMDRRPGRIADILPIALPRPRPLSVRETPAFAAYGRSIRETFESLGILKHHP